MHSSGPGNLNKTKKNEKKTGFFNIPLSAWKIFKKNS